MKKILSQIVIYAFSMLLVANCTFDDVNIDETKASDVNMDPNFILSTVQLRYSGSTDFSYETWRAQLIYLSTMMQHLSTVQGYWAGNYYTQNNAYLAAYWERAYEEQVRYAVDLLELTKDKPVYANLHQIARIWKAVVFHRITDLYGDAPYFEAGQGYYKGITAPVYDTQESIYMDMLKELDEAGTALQASINAGVSVDPDISGDMIYQGDLTKWFKFANSMMLRLGMRLTKVAPDQAKMWAEKASQKGTLTSNADNAKIVHTTNGDRITINRISQVMNLSYESPSLKWSRTLTDYLKSNDDPRLNVISERIDGVTSSFDGMPNGYDLGGGATDISNEPNYPGNTDAYARPKYSVFANPTGPTFFLTYAESELLLAEAAQRGWNVNGDASTHYVNGVRAAMESISQFDPSATVEGIDAYLAAHPYDAANGIEMINNEYWMATIFNEYETFANWRRTGYPELIPVNYPGNATNGTIPRRFLYPVSEEAQNGENYQAALSRLSGGNLLTSRVWWDK